MGACVSTGEIAADPGQALVVDVHKVIADHVWTDFRESQLSWWARRSLKRHKQNVQVPMNYFLFEKTKQEIFIRKQGDRDSSGKETDKQPCDNKSSPEGQGLQTYFKNDTGEPQAYQFHFEKMRRSEARVSYQKGFSFGGCTDFSLELPKILPGGELGAELDMHMEVTKSEEQTFEETSTTSMNSDITVSAHSRCVAKVILEDTHFTADYKVHVTMSMPAKAAHILILNKHGETVSDRRITKLRMLFPGHELKDKDGNIRQDAVLFVVEGVIHGTQISNQKIKLDSEPLEANR